MAAHKYFTRRTLNFIFLNNDAYRFRNFESKNQSGLLLPWSFYGLGFGLHGDASCSVLHTGMADAADSYGSLGPHLHPSVVVRIFMYCVVVLKI